MKKNIVYIYGLFESRENPLTQYLKEHTSPGDEYHCIAPFSKDEFGTQSFYQIVQQTQDSIDTIRPEMIIAHSLGAYVAMYISTNQPLILLDPSLAIADIITGNITQDGSVSFYDDGRYRIKLSLEFLESIKATLPIEKVARNVKARDIHIFGAGNGGYKIAEQYHQYIPHSHYAILPSATHEFKEESDRQKILAVIKKRLNITLSHEEDGRTGSW